MHARLLRREPDWPVLRIRPLGARRFVDSDSRPMKVSTIASASTPRYLVSVPDNGDSRWSRYGLPAL